MNNNSNDEREMTLDEWVGKLPQFHRAHKELYEMKLKISHLTNRIRSALVIGGIVGFVFGAIVMGSFG